MHVVEIDEHYDNLVQYNSLCNSESY